MDKTSMILGWLTGRMIAGRRSKNEPVAYLYNGVKLPDIYKVYTPELQKSHPLAVINYHSSTGNYTLNLFADQNYFESYGEVLFGYEEIAQKFARFKNVDDEWVFNSTLGAWNFSVDKSGDLESSPPIWTNFDLNYSDGTIYVAASDPVPVYEQKGW